MTSKDSVTRMLCCKCSRRVAMEFKGWWKSCMKLQSFWNQVMPKKLQNVCFSISNVFHGWRFFTVTPRCYYLSWDRRPIIYTIWPSSCLKLGLISTSSTHSRKRAFSVRWRQLHWGHMEKQCHKGRSNVTSCIWPFFCGRIGTKLKEKNEGRAWSWSQFMPWVEKKNKFRVSNSHNRIHSEYFNSRPKRTMLD